MSSLRSIATVSTLLAASAGAMGCGSSAAGSIPAAPPLRRVVATLYPLAEAARRVSGAGAEVLDLTPAGAEPHDLELTAEDLRQLLAADLIVFARGMQPAVDAIAASRPEAALDVLAIPGLRPLRGRSATPTRGEHHHPAPLDPHVWLDPRRFQLVAAAIAARLGAASEATPFLNELAALDAEFAARLAECRRRELVAAHAAFGYLADRYGLNQIALSGFEPETEPGPRDLERLIEQARAVAARNVFVEPALEPRFAAVVARETGASITPLDPIETIAAEGRVGGADYFSIMRVNLAALTTSLECSRSSS